MSNISRRKFLKTGAAALAGITIAPSTILGMSHGHISPTDKLNLAAVGIGGMGHANINHVKGTENIVALCDVDWKYAKGVFDEFPKAKKYWDYRKMYEEMGKSIDGVIIATPDHWHAVQTIEACRAGKDVYVEKPMSHSIEEGRAMADAVKKYNRVLQVGNMQRSWRNFRHACELVRNGYIGEIKEVKVSIGPPPVKYDLPAQPVPKTLDWEMWIGPAPMNVYNEELAPPMERNMFPNWRNYREYGGGMICDWGAHMFDIAQWALGMDDSGPIEFTPPEEGELKPLSMRYANGTVMTHEPFRKADGNAVRFIGSDGVIDISRSFLDTIPAKLQDEVIGDDKIKLYKSDDHYNDFLTAMKTRKQPLSTVEIGHRTASLCHIVNLCYEFDRKLVWNPEKEVFFFDDEANRRRGNPIREPYSLKV